MASYASACSQRAAQALSSDQFYYSYKQKGSYSLMIDQHSENRWPLCSVQGISKNLRGFGYKTEVRHYFCNAKS